MKNYDYSSIGLYYVILCMNRRLCLFSNIEDEEMKLNDAGKMVHGIWQEIRKYYPGVEIDEHIVMPNHFHGIINLNNNDVGAPPRGRPGNRAGTETCPYGWTNIIMGCDRTI